MRRRPFTRREIVLVLTTAVVAFAVAVPLTTASSERAAREFTIWPGSTARFANMDWRCEYLDANFTKQHNIPPSIDCGRESSPTGVVVQIDGEAVYLAKCRYTNKARTNINCWPPLRTVKRDP
jgi:hypothetical protein